MSTSLAEDASVHASMYISISPNPRKAWTHLETAWLLHAESYDVHGKLEKN